MDDFFESDSGFSDLNTSQNHWKSDRKIVLAVANGGEIKNGLGLTKLSTVTKI